MGYGRREQDEADANFSFLLSNLEDEAKKAVTDFAFTQLQAMAFDPHLLMQRGNDLFCGPEKKFHEGAFLCLAGRKILWPWSV